MATNFRKSLVAALKANTDLAALVNGQIAASYAPSSFKSVWVVFTKISGREEGAHDGNQNLTERRFQFTVSGDTKTLVDQVSEILITQFNAFKFTAFPSTPQEQELVFFHEDDRETWEEAPRSYSATVDLKIQANI